MVTVVYNGVNEISRTIDSTLAQDYANIEYIVIDGHSTDGTQAVVEGYGSAIDVFVSESDRGVYDAMNKAIARASGEFLLFMNCGDLFASAYAVSTAMAAVTSGKEQIVFGRWIRRMPDGEDMHCSPSLSTSTFNHQALIYSRSIHSWHGGYVTVPGLTTADYLFFATLLRSSVVTCKTIEATIASIDVNGMSAGEQTFGQKNAIDFLCGRVSKPVLVGRLAAHPLYFRAKRLLRWLR